VISAQGPPAHFAPSRCLSYVPTMPAVLVRDLVKRYDNVEAVRGVSFEIAEGEIFGFLGPNGAGKSTTLECILGLVHPDGGSISIAGIDALGEPDLVKGLIGAALQSTGLQEKITPREALDLFGSFYDNAIATNELISRFGLGDKVNATFDTLSGGQKQRLALAIAFVNNPKLIFLDEPTAGLDPQSRRDLHGAIAGLKADGRTVVLTTHYIEEAHQLCDRIAIIDHGRVIAMGKPDELIAGAKTGAKIVLKTRTPLDALMLSALPGVVSAECGEGEWRLSTGNVSQTIFALIKRLDSDGNELLDLQIRRPSLEDVFIELTGNRIEGD
jgi:ABC-2 type transport system ATP-binding protein